VLAAQSLIESRNIFFYRLISQGHGMLGKFKRVVERCCGVDIYRFDPRIIQIIDSKKRDEAWFSYTSILRSILEEYRVDLILDVGANIGQFVFGLRHFYKGTIISFEPVPHIFKALERASSNDNEWLVYNYALGDESKEQIINITENEVFSSLLESNEYCFEHFGELSTVSRREKILIRCFDDIINEIPLNIYDKHIFLKMDTQGFDLEVFSGSSSIRENIMALQSEVSQKAIYKGMPHWTESIDVYEKAGFRLAGLYPVTRDGLQYIECDCLMVKNLENRKLDKP
jgi:FkbM family methyltransferase